MGKLKYRYLLRNIHHKSWTKPCSLNAPPPQLDIHNILLSLLPLSICISHSSPLFMGLPTPFHQYLPHHAWTFPYSPPSIYMHPHSTLCMSSGNTHLTSFQLFHTHTCTWHSCLVACHHDAMHLPSYTTNDIHCL